MEASSTPTIRRLIPLPSPTFAHSSVEFAFTNSISGKLEYNYMDFGTRTYTFGPVSSPFADPGSGESVELKIRQNIHLVKVGLNYRFDVGKYPVTARY